jgi:hypothetical protein
MNSANRNTNAKKPYCKVCHDAGKPESMYTSHCVKTYNVRTGKTETTCPTLNALECRFCYKSGHTVKFCPVLEENKKMDINRARDHARNQYKQQAQQQEQQQQTETKKLKNAYAALADDSDDEQQAPATNEVLANEVARNEVVTNVVDNFPALPKKSYSSVASTPKPVPVVVAPAPVVVVRKDLKKKTLSWVEAQAYDDSDSDAEVYESDEEVQQVAPASLPCYAPRSQYTDEDW